MKAIFYSFLVVVLTACATAASNRAVSPQEAEGFDYGVYPDNYEQVVKTYFEEVLKDPFSANYRFRTKPRSGYIRKRSMWEGGLAGKRMREIEAIGHVVIVDVNAKNSFGAYTGWREHRLLIRDGVVVGSFEPNRYFDEPWYQ